MFADVILVIFSPFHTGYRTSRPHSDAQILAIFGEAFPRSHGPSA